MEQIDKIDELFTVRLTERGGGEGSATPALIVKNVHFFILFSLKFDSLTLKTHFTSL